MNGDWERERITGWFRDLRRSEEDRIPPFAGVWEAAVVRAAHRCPPAVLFRLATAAAILVFLAAPALWWWHRHKQTDRALTEAVSIAQWKSPTAFLMDTPGREMLRTVPRIGEGFVDMNAPAGRSRQ